MRRDDRPAEPSEGGKNITNVPTGLGESDDAGGMGIDHRGRVVLRVDAGRPHQA